MASENCHCRRLDWDSNHFGLAVAQLHGQRCGETAIGGAAQWADFNGIDCLYWLAEDSPSALHSAAKHGFELVDRRVTFHRSIPTGPLADFGVRLARPNDLPVLERIAAASHHDSRFYRDGRFDREKSDELYRIWLRRSFEGWAREVLVAEMDGVPAGYCSWHDEGDGTARIGLIAVSEQWRGRGLGRRLIDATLARCQASRFTGISVRTQGINAAAQSLYEACGFTPVLVQLWFHRWKEKRQ